MRHTALEKKMYEAGMGSRNEALHEIDYEDVSISVEAVKLITRAARSVMKSHMPGSVPDTITSSQAVAMFIDRLFWDEDTGKLILCMEMVRKSFCLPIPRAHWSYRSQGLLQ